MGITLLINTYDQCVGFEGADVFDIGCNSHHQPYPYVFCRVLIIGLCHLVTFKWIERSAVVPDSEYYPVFRGKQPDVDQILLSVTEPVLDDVLAYLLDKEGRVIA